LNSNLTVTNWQIYHNNFLFLIIGIAFYAFAPLFVCYCYFLIFFLFFFSFQRGGADSATGRPRPALRVFRASFSNWSQITVYIFLVLF